MTEQRTLARHTPSRRTGYVGGAPANGTTSLWVGVVAAVIGLLAATVSLLRLLRRRTR